MARSIRVVRITVAVLLLALFVVHDSSTGAHAGIALPRRSPLDLTDGVSGGGSDSSKSKSTTDSSGSKPATDSSGDSKANTPSSTDSSVADKPTSPSVPDKAENTPGTATDKSSSTTKPTGSTGTTPNGASANSGSNGNAVGAGGSTLPEAQQAVQPIGNAAANKKNAEATSAHDGGLSAGGIVGIVIGCVFCLGLVGMVVLRKWKLQPTNHRRARLNSDYNANYIPQRTETTDATFIRNLRD
ncbi:hypothetical protein THASP1DRAFT_21795 [Thamnocephalis sphaerospora]|uniref:Mid2 domain-containing protein n=1 Tax=Thamnocephalis sphaerospora TaxID=78915 RepID=A0A4P9XW33_9FUNG|nr:hypothetical protein THASP1DRAFT_21795 [Thamnocephalis sphaerospora]|eukprot:RKP10523.1 hypothetical protein THASP1DRAFT_21795 [Thamnocephalis sphaerospora]